MNSDWSLGVFSTRTSQLQIRITHYFLDVPIWTRRSWLMKSRRRQTRDTVPLTGRSSWILILHPGSAQQMYMTLPGGGGVKSALLLRPVATMVFRYEKSNLCNGSSEHVKPHQIHCSKPIQHAHGLNPNCTQFWWYCPFRSAVHSKQITNLLFLCHLTVPSTLRVCSCI
jgi:hypothetical protein